MTYKIEVPGLPVAKARARFGRGHTYTPKKTVDYEERIRWAAAEAKVKPIVGAVWLRIWVFLPVPASWSARKRKLALSHALFPTTRPDGDNYAKIVMDALNGIGYNDDAQVASLFVAKRYSDRTRIEIIILSEEEP